MTPPLINRSTGQVVQADHMNDIKAYIEDGTYRVNSKRLEIQGVEVFTETGKMILPVDGSANNKDIDELKNATFYGEYDNGNSGASKTIDWNNGQKQKLTLTESCSIDFSNLNKGSAHMQLKLIHAGSSYVPTLPATIRWPGGTLPTWSATDGCVDIVNLFYDGSNYWANGSVDYKVTA